MITLINKIFVYIYAWHYEMNNNTSKVEPTGIASFVLSVPKAVRRIHIRCAQYFYSLRPSLFNSIINI